MQDQKHTLTVESAGISVRLQLPRRARCVLVLGHGAGSNMNHSNMESIAEAMLQQDIGVFRYNFPYAERGSRRIDARPVILATVQGVFRHAWELVPGLPLLGGGHSFGGRMTSTAHSQQSIAGLRGLVFCSFPLHPAGKPSDQRGEHLKPIDLPMLFLSGTRDRLADGELLKNLTGGLPRATLHLLDTADHGYRVLKRSRVSEEDVFSEMGRVTADWLDGVLE